MLIKYDVIKSEVWRYEVWRYKWLCFVVGFTVYNLDMELERSGMVVQFAVCLYKGQTMPMKYKEWFNNATIRYQISPTSVWLVKKYIETKFLLSRQFYLKSFWVCVTSDLGSSCVDILLTLKLCNWMRIMMKIDGYNAKKL